MPDLLLNQTATIEKYEGSGAYGPSYTDPVEYDCRFEPQQKKVTNENGEEIVSNGTFYFGPDVDVNIKSLITYEGTEYEAVQINPVQGLSSLNHYEVVVK